MHCVVWTGSDGVPWTWWTAQWMVFISWQQMGYRGPGERHNGWRLYHHDRWGAVDLVDVTMDRVYIITTDGVPWTWWTAQWMALISSRQMGCRGPGERHNGWCLYHHDRWGAVDLVYMRMCMVVRVFGYVRVNVGWIGFCVRVNKFTHITLTGIVISMHILAGVCIQTISSQKANQARRYTYSRARGLPCLSINTWRICVININKRYMILWYYSIICCWFVLWISAGCLPSKHEWIYIYL